MKRLVLLLVVLSGLVVAAAPTSASAYGGSAKIFELTVSANCDNAANPLCAPFPAGFGLGGAWEWWEVDGASPSATEGTADGTVTFCAHGAKSFHANVNDTGWIILSAAQLAANNAGSPPGEQIFETDGGQAASYIVIPAGGIAWPDAPGKYAISAGPGVQVQSTVTAVG